MAKTTISGYKERIKSSSRQGEVVVGGVGLESGERGEDGGGVAPDVPHDVVDGAAVDGGLAEVDGRGGHPQGEVDVERLGRRRRRVGQR